MVQRVQPEVRSPAIVTEIPKVLTPADPAALRRLRSAFEERESLAVLVDRGIARTERVLDVFASQLEDEADVVILPAPLEDTTACMQALIARLGFETSGLTVSDLDHICAMFLNYQKTHGQRTVICLPQVQNCSAWVLESLSGLLKLEAERSLGLLIVLAGDLELPLRLKNSPLAAAARQSDRPISVNPLTAEESRTFVRQFFAAADRHGLEELISYDAVTHLHTISGGVADRLYNLCHTAYCAASETSAFPISVDAIDEAVRLLDRPPASDDVNGADADRLSDDELLSPEAMQVGNGTDVRYIDRLVIHQKGQSVRAMTINNDAIGIGRDADSVVHLTSPLVSRHHALLLSSREGVKLLDLGSTNGTFVNDERVEDRVLKHGDVITFGDITIEYLRGEKIGETARAAVARTISAKIADYQERRRAANDSPDDTGSRKNLSGISTGETQISRPHAS